MDDFHYMRNARGGEELFHYLSHPAERVNLVDRASARSQLTRLRNLLAAAERTSTG